MISTLAAPVLLAFLLGATVFSDRIGLATYPVVAKGSVILVTGTSSGIGNGITRMLLKNNFEVFATVRKEKDRERLSQQMSGAANLHSILVDISNETQIIQALDAIESFLVRNPGMKFGGVVNNAGILAAGPMQHMPFHKIEQTVTINLISQIRVAGVFLPLLLSSRARLINIGSLAGVIHPGCNAAYNAAKGGLHAWSSSMRRELQHKGVGVSLIAMGETKGTALHANRPSGVDWTGYETMHNAFDQGALWMRNSFLGATQTMIDRAVLHAIQSSQPRRVYWAPEVVRIFSLLPDWMIELMMMGPPPEYLMPTDDRLNFKASE